MIIEAEFKPHGVGSKRYLDFWCGIGKPAEVWPYDDRLKAWDARKKGAGCGPIGAHSTCGLQAVLFVSQVPRHRGLSCANDLNMWNTLGQVIKVFFAWFQNEARESRLVFAIKSTAFLPIG